MNPISRRNLLRTAGGAAGATGIVGATAASGHGMKPVLEGPAGGGRDVRKIRAKLDREIYSPGERMTLRIDEKLKKGRKLHVVDSTGRRWKRVTKAKGRQIWTTRATTVGKGTVLVRATRADGRFLLDREVKDRAHYKVIDARSGSEVSAALIGMSAPSSVWDQRVREVGAGLGARRIFADLGRGAKSQLKYVERAHADGMLPVVSYKVGGDLRGAIAGRYNAVAKEAAALLAAYDKPTAVSFWHEPNGDMSGADYVAASRQIVPQFQRGQLRVGPILNGWLLARQEDEFASYCPDEMLDLWDWMGIDTYEAGTSASSAGPGKPADRIRDLSRFVRSRGYDLPLGIGEYNGHSAATIRSAGEALLTTPNVWFGCLWNADAERSWVLSGSRLAAFRETVRDPRAAEPG